MSIVPCIHKIQVIQIWAVILLIFLGRNGYISRQKLTVAHQSNMKKKLVSGNPCPILEHTRLSQKSTQFSIDKEMKYQ